MVKVCILEIKGHPKSPFLAVYNDIPGTEDRAVIALQHGVTAQDIIIHEIGYIPAKAGWKVPLRALKYP